MSTVLGTASAYSCCNCGLVFMFFVSTAVCPGQRHRCWCVNKCHVSRMLVAAWEYDESPQCWQLCGFWLAEYLWEPLIVGGLRPRDDINVCVLADCISVVFAVWGTSEAIY